jgi:predicted aldo/keto reductase-like oxidoreductase
MRDHRSKFFLATKTDERTYAAAREQIRRSLERLGVDHVDLIQLHCLVHPAEWDTALGEDGALRAAVEAREEGLVRFIGVTGHGSTVAEMHRRSLERFPFDSVLLPYSYVQMQDPVYAADTEALLRECAMRRIAVQTIKGICRGPWGSKQPEAATWYEPLEEQEDIDLAVHWVLGRQEVFLNSAGDLRLLPAILHAAERFTSCPSDEELASLAVSRRMTSLFV